MNRDTARLIYRFIFNLYPFKQTILVCNQIEWRMLSYRIQNCKSLLEQVKLSLQNTQVALLFGMVH